jgi:hypothetical protein
VSSSTESADPTTTTPAERRSSEPSQPRSELTPSTTPSDRSTPDLPRVARSPARPADTPDHGRRPLDTRPRDEHFQPPDIDRHRPLHRRIGHDAAPRPRRRTPVRPPDRQTAAVFGSRRPTRPLARRAPRSPRRGHARRSPWTDPAVGPTPATSDTRRVREPPTPPRRARPPTGATLRSRERPLAARDARRRRSYGCLPPIAGPIAHQFARRESPLDPPRPAGSRLDRGLPSRGGVRAVSHGLAVHTLSSRIQWWRERPQETGVRAVWRRTRNERGANRSGSSPRGRSVPTARPGARDPRNALRTARVPTVRWYPGPGIDRRELGARRCSAPGSVLSVPVVSGWLVSSTGALGPGLAGVAAPVSLRVSGVVLVRTPFQTRWCVCESGFLGDDFATVGSGASANAPVTGVGPR